MRDLLQRLASYCRKHGLRPPSRATVYSFINRTPCRSYAADKLPAEVRRCLYNLSENSRVPGPQLVFYAFNYGSTQAVSHAAGLPWLQLHQAARMPGWRPRSKGLLEAVMRLRRI